MGKSGLEFVILLLMASFAVGAVIIWKDTSADRVPDDIRFAGSADGKTFFAVSNPTALNFSEAGEVCEQLNMKLAEITSLAQGNAIQAMANSSQITSFDYWVAARDAWNYRQFSWNATNTELSEINSVIASYIQAPLSCIIHNPRKGQAKTLMAIFPCSSRFSRLLCEVPTSSQSTVAKYMAISANNTHRI